MRFVRLLLRKTVLAQPSLAIIFSTRARLVGVQLRAVRRVFLEQIGGAQVFWMWFCCGGRLVYSACTTWYTARVPCAGVYAFRKLSRCTSDC